MTTGGALEWLMRAMPFLTGAVMSGARWLVAVQRANAALPRMRSDLQTARPLRSHGICRTLCLEHTV